MLLGLVPSSIVPAAGGVSEAFPFAHAVDLFGAALSDADPAGTVLREAAWLLGLTLVFAALARVARAKMVADEREHVPDDPVAASAAHAGARGSSARPGSTSRSSSSRCSSAPARASHAAARRPPGHRAPFGRPTCDEAEELAGLGIRAVLLFGIPEEKDELASEAYDEDGIVQRALRGAARPRARARPR